MSKEYAPCIKCSELTGSKTGICGPCRTMDCKTCKTTFTYKEIGQTECSACRNIRRARYRRMGG